MKQIPSARYLVFKQIVDESEQAKNQQFHTLPVHASESEARSTLGQGKGFRYAEENTDGVSSPKSSTIAVTGEDP
jgi:hypothetical protein